MPPTKREAADADAAEMSKKYRSAIDALADEWICPITHELPLDPVTASDGRVYERSAITSWLMRELPAGQPAKSPVTNEPMSPRLIPAPQVRNTIRGMVASGAVSGDKAEAWKTRLQEQEEVEEMRRKAEGGDIKMASRLGDKYYLGKVIRRDYAQALRWYKFAADGGDSHSLMMCGSFYANGLSDETITVIRNEARAIMYFTWSAAVGERSGAKSCMNLGNAFKNGKLGLDEDKEEATKWYDKAFHLFSTSEDVN